MKICIQIDIYGNIKEVISDEPCTVYVLDIGNIQKHSPKLNIERMEAVERIYHELFEDNYLNSI